MIIISNIVRNFWYFITKCIKPFNALITLEFYYHLPKNIKNFLFPSKIDIPSPNSKLITLALCFTAGFIGGHRIYTKRYFTALLMAITFGFCFIGVINDFLKIIHDEFYDWRGRPVIKWRTKGDYFALIGTMMTPYITFKILPEVPFIFLDIFLEIGLYSTLLTPETVFEIQEKVQYYTGNGIKTDLKAPKITISQEKEY